MCYVHSLVHYNFIWVCHIDTGSLWWCEIIRWSFIVINRSAYLGYTSVWGFITSCSLYWRMLCIALTFNLHQSLKKYSSNPWKSRSMWNVEELKKELGAHLECFFKNHFNNIHGSFCLEHWIKGIFLLQILRISTKIPESCTKFFKLQVPRKGKREREFINGLLSKLHHNSCACRY